MTAPKSRRSLRLVSQLYLLVALSVVITGSVLAVNGYLMHEAGGESDGDGADRATQAGMARSMTSLIVAAGDDAGARQGVAESLHEATHLSISVYGADGSLWATRSRGHEELGPLTPAELDRLRQQRSLVLDDPPRVAAAVESPSGELVAYGIVHFRGRRPPEWLPTFGLPPSVIPPPLLWTLIVLLAVLALVSVLFARSLARPMTTLSEAARALGAGDLTARARLGRHDELGEVGDAFDEMAQRLSGLLRSQTELLANASHELRTPLARIRVALDIAAEGDAELAREQLGEIGQDLQELESLVSDILILARLDLERDRLEASRQPLRLEPVVASDLVEGAAARFRRAHPARPLRVECSPGLPLLRADPVLLRRVLDNLLDNAARYSGSEGELSLSARGEGEMVLLEVSDEGIGLEPEDLERVFDPFFRADRSRARGSGGVGLGLALARRVVEAHGGTISAESAPGLGSTFRVVLRADNEVSAP